LGGDALEEFVTEFAVVKSILLADVFVEATIGFPIGDIVDAEVSAVFAEAGLNFFVRDAVDDHLAELIADFLREAADFALMPVFLVIPNVRLAVAAWCWRARRRSNFQRVAVGASKAKRSRSGSFRQGLRSGTRGYQGV